MQRIDARNRSSSHVDEFILSFLESIMLDIILRAFIRELFDSKIRREATREMISLDRSLKIIYQLTEETRRTNIEIQKLYDEEVRQDELSFYRELTQQSLSQIKIEAMLTQYHFNRLRSKSFL
jgi:beta-glucosidase/6-phospho-beta-glucosidase/beta-galactosidase